jgi:hypothetical protein
MPARPRRTAQRHGDGNPLARGERLQAGLGPVADAARGGVEDPPQADRVGRVGQHAQVGERVAHLLALVEAHAADDLVRQADADEHLLEDPGLRVGPVEDGHLVRLDAVLVAEPVDLAATKAASSCSLSAT